MHISKGHLLSWLLQLQTSPLYASYALLLYSWMSLLRLCYRSSRNCKWRAAAAYPLRLLKTFYVISQTANYVAYVLLCEFPILSYQNVAQKFLLDAGLVVYEYTITFDQEVVQV